MLAYRYGTAGTGRRWGNPDLVVRLDKALARPVMGVPRTPCPQNSRIRKVWIMKTASKVLLALAVLGGLVIVAGAAAFVVLSLDESPPDDSDLRVERLDIPDDQNAFTYFEQAAQVLYWPGYEPPEDEDEEERDEVSDDAEAKAEQEKEALLERMLEGETWDEDLAAEILERNEDAFVLFEKGLACPHFQVPEVKSVNSTMPCISAYEVLGKLACLRAFVAVRAGDYGTAFEEAMKAVRFGHSIEGAKGCLLHYLIGASVKGLGLRFFQEILPEALLSVAQLREFVDCLSNFRSDAKGLADMFRTEYGVAKRAVEDVQSGEESLGLKGLPSLFDRPNRLVFRPNETKRMLAEAYRPFVQNADQHYELPDMPERREWPSWRLWLPGNTIGHFLYGLFSLEYTGRGALRLKCAENIEVAATWLLIAMKAYKMEQGRLPETLEELVPEYIDAVPLDDFDGKPMRYNSEKRVIYSVGEDFKDDGGMTKEEQEAWWKEEDPWSAEEGYEPDVWQMPDPSFPIEF